MSAKEENSAVIDVESDIDSMVSVLQSDAPPPLLISKRLRSPKKIPENQIKSPH